MGGGCERQPLTRGGGRATGASSSSRGAHVSRSDETRYQTQARCPTLLAFKAKSHEMYVTTHHQRSCASLFDFFSFLSFVWSIHKRRHLQCVNYSTRRYTAAATTRTPAPGPVPLQVPLQSSPAPSSSATRSNTASRTRLPSNVAVSRAVAMNVSSHRRSSPRPVGPSKQAAVPAGR